MFLALYRMTPLHHQRGIDRAAGRERNDDSGDVARGGLAEGRLSDWHCYSAKHERTSRDRGHCVPFELPSQSRSGYCTKLLRLNVLLSRIGCATRRRCLRPG